MNQIAVSIASGEAARIDLLKAALGGDNRFMPLQIAADLPVDLRFEIDGKRLNMELKLPRDWVGSVLGGHLQEQVLHIRELLEDGCIVILGNLEAIYEAIRDSATGRGIKQSEIHHVIASTHARCKSFRKRSMLNGVPVFFQGDDSGFFDGLDQWADLLELAADYLTDGSLMGFRQRPADGEREIAASSMLFKNMGPSLMATLLQDYSLMFCPKKGARAVEDLPGFGPKRAAIIRSKIVGDG